MFLRKYLYFETKVTIIAFSSSKLRKLYLKRKETTKYLIIRFLYTISFLLSVLNIYQRDIMRELQYKQI